MRHLRLIVAILPVGGCADPGNVGRAPEFTAPAGGEEYHAMMVPGLAARGSAAAPGDGASLWNVGQRSLLGDRRAGQRGDILTVVIDIDDSASMSDSSRREQSGSQEMSIGALFGLPGRVESNSGVSLSPAVKTGSSSGHEGSGAIRRNEKLTLRIAATVVEVLPNGILAIAGTQEVRVNFELRELLITGYVRPGDVSRQNEITYDKIASARISYGGRGRITEVQQPRYGQQLADIVLPF